jgi:hypothetical protein
MPRKERREIQEWILSDLRSFAKAKDTPPLYKLTVLMAIANFAKICDVPIAMPVRGMRPQEPPIPDPPKDSDAHILKQLEEFSRESGGGDASNS